MLNSRAITTYVSARCLSYAGLNRTSRARRTLSTCQWSIPFGKVHLSNRRLLLVSGVDAPKFLQGLTTNNVDPMRAEGWYTAFLHAQGRVLYDAFIYPIGANRSFRDLLTRRFGVPAQRGRETEEDWACLIDVDAAEITSLAQHLKRHKLRSKVDLHIIDEGQWTIWAVHEPKGELFEDMVALQDRRAPNLGFRILCPADFSLKTEHSSGEVNSLETYDINRFLLGVAEGPQEILRGQALPLESNIDLMGGIDFKKGCYVGQELTIRTAHTGIVRKRILPVCLYPTGSTPPSALNKIRHSTGKTPPLGTEISSAQTAESNDPEKHSEPRRRNRTRAAGTFLRSIDDIGLALCRLETMTDVRLTAEGGGWRPETEFEMRWSATDGTRHDVRTTAFVPVWHKDRQRSKAQKSSTAAQSQGE